MTNKEFIKMLTYEERVMRELHGVKVALPFTVALEAAKAAIEATKYDKPCTCDGDWTRATGAVPIPDDGRDGWNVGR